MATVDMKTSNISNALTGLSSRVKVLDTRLSVDELKSVDTGLTQAGLLEVDNIKDYRKIADNISKKLDSKYVRDLADSANSLLTKGELTISPELVNLTKNDMINKISNELSKPGLPLNKKSMLMKLIKKYCDDKSAVGFSSGLKDLLSMLSTSALAKLIACISNPIKLTNMLYGLLTETLDDSLDDHKLSKIVTDTIKTKKVNAKTLVEIARTDKGKDLIAQGLVEAHDVYYSIDGRPKDKISRSLSDVGTGINKDDIDNLLNTTNTNDNIIKSKYRSDSSLYKINEISLKSKEKPAINTDTNTIDIPDIGLNHILRIKEKLIG